MPECDAPFVVVTGRLFTKAVVGGIAMPNVVAGDSRHMPCVVMPP
jgi:hypothetical protein